MLCYTSTRISVLDTVITSEHPPEQRIYNSYLQHGLHPLTTAPSKDLPNRILLLEPDVTATHNLE
jgi:hypothetical protein